TTANTRANWTALEKLSGSTKASTTCSGRGGDETYRNPVSRRNRVSAEGAESGQMTHGPPSVPLPTLHSRIGTTWRLPAARPARTGGPLEAFLRSWSCLLAV